MIQRAPVFASLYIPQEYTDDGNYTATSSTNACVTMSRPARFDLISLELSSRWSLKDYYVEYLAK